MIETISSSHTGKKPHMEQIPFIRRPKDWPFPIPEITAEAINDLVDAIERGDRYLGSLYDELMALQEKWIIWTKKHSCVITIY